MAGFHAKSRRLCVAAAAACLLALAALLQTALPLAKRDRPTASEVVSTPVLAPASAFEHVNAPMLTLRVQSADLLQMSPGFLARTSSQIQPNYALTAIRLDLSLDTAVDQLQ